MFHSERKHFSSLIIFAIYWMNERKKPKNLTVSTVQKHTPIPFNHKHTKWLKSNSFGWSNKKKVVVPLSSSQKFSFPLTPSFFTLNALNLILATTLLFCVSSLNCPLFFHQLKWGATHGQPNFQHTKFLFLIQNGSSYLGSTSSLNGGRFSTDWKKVRCKIVHHSLYVSCIA